MASSSKLSNIHKSPLLVESDMISNLPENLRQKVLTYLSIKEAGRTSVLSRKWRYTWASIPELGVVDTTNSSNDLVKFVDAIFVLHNGPIRKFNLFTNKYCPEAFGRWIVNLSRNGIKELTLNLSFPFHYEDYMMHSKFFSCDKLTYISLSNCLFRVPDEFVGFELLHTLELNFLIILEGEIEKLISRCPLLKNFKLRFWMYPAISVNIDTPNLLSLDIDGQFRDLQLCAPKLVFLRLAFVNIKMPAVSENLERSLCNLPNLQCFELSGIFLRYLGAKHLLEGISLNCLKYLKTDLEFQTEKEMAFVLALFQGAPNLHSLHVDVCLEDERPTLPSTKLWEKVDRKADLLKHLLTVEIVDIRALDSIFSFIKFVLDSAPQLVTLTIKANPRLKIEDEMIILKQLLLLPRASLNAQIIYK